MRAVKWAKCSTSTLRETMRMKIFKWRTKPTEWKSRNKHGVQVLLF